MYSENHSIWQSEFSPRGKDRKAAKSILRHTSEVECIAKGKAHKPYEFGVKVSVATTLRHSRGGQFTLHAKALPGNPYDDDTLKDAIPTCRP